MIHRNQDNWLPCRRISALLAFAVTLGGASVHAQTPGHAMRRYVDPVFGFSFWYPATWTVTREMPAKNPTASGWYQGGSVVARLSVVGDDSQGVYIDELVVPSGNLTEHGNDGANPVGVDQKYFFDANAHTWMYATLSESPDGHSPYTESIEKPMTTMGGQPIFRGAQRHMAEVIVPLDRTHFLTLTTGDPGGNMDHQYLAETIIAGNAAAVRRATTKAQANLIHLEAKKLGVNGVAVRK